LRWAEANPALAEGGLPSAEALDAVLHAERLDARRQRVTFPERLDALPDAAFVVQAGAAWLVRDGRLWPWRPESYGPPAAWPGETVVEVLTPRSVVNMLRAGWPVQVDGSRSIGGKARVRPLPCRIKGPGRDW
jgi:hypothetical protein